jgi:hypothetical protein
MRRPWQSPAAAARRRAQAGSTIRARVREPRDAIVSIPAKDSEPRDSREQQQAAELAASAHVQAQ